MQRPVEATRPLPVVFFVLFLLASPLLPSGALGADAPAVSNPSDPLFAMNGSFSARYVSRSADASGERFRDQDFFEELRLDITMPKTPKYEFHFLGTSRQDADGDQEPRTFSPFEDIGDAGNSRTKSYLYEARLDVNRPFSSLPQARIGRQAGTRDEPVFFDGIAMDLEAARDLALTLYGGAAVHLYELDSDWGDDTLAGAGIDYVPFRSTSLSLDYLSLEDERRFSTTSTRRDSLMSLKLWQRLSSAARAMAKYRFINGDPRDVSVRAVATYVPADIELNANYFRQFHPQNELANELSPYFDVIGRSDPYQTYDIKARKLFGEHAALDIGYYKRALLEEHQQSAFNREYTRSYAVLQFLDVVTSGFTVSLTGERWDSGEREFSSTGGDIGYRFKTKGKTASVGAGTYFSLFKYDYYVDLGERTRVRTYFVNGKYPLGKGYSVNAAYDFESGIEDYQTVKLGMRYDF